ncbi:unnamed protein product [Linum trigynum]|uniref:FAR1 domain-containing protein n=1 Tax=Linum trigynum TaxID=586398 RepID=A0AAV2D287_9ROSI
MIKCSFLSSLLTGVTSNRTELDYTCLGLAFKTIEETKQFYKNYAHDLGFSVRDMGAVKRSTKRQPTKTARYARYCCSKEGYKTTSKSNPKNKGTIDVKAYQRAVPETRVGCPAIIKFRYDIEKDEWLLDKWITEHNHDLLPAKFKHLLRSNKGISEMHAMVAQVHADCGVSLRKSYELFTTTSGGRENVPFTPHDLKNYITGTRQKSMKPGEATILLEYFRHEAYRNPSFFYEIEVDSNEDIASIFWADARMRFDYSCFGDTISFDTTYRTNQNYRPLGQYSLHYLIFLRFRS